jgi:hypothetical protein
LNTEALGPGEKLNILSRVETDGENMTSTWAGEWVWRGDGPFSDEIFELGEETRDGVDGVNAMDVGVGIWNEGVALLLSSLLFLFGGSWSSILTDGLSLHLLFSSGSCA